MLATEGRAKSAPAPLIVKITGSTRVTQSIEFYWDIGSTNSYFAFHLIRPIAKRYDATIVSHPFNLGYVFRKQNYVLMEEPREKIANRIVDLGRWARRYDLPFKVPATFPIKTSRALRAVLAARTLGREWDFMEKLFAAYWEKGDASIAEYEGLRKIASELGINPDELERLSESDQIRDQLAAETDSGLELGVFGAPTFFVGREMFWGKDRMDFIEDELAKAGGGRR
jgi:2-hydroxychromene-2-carboxylate isomerase